MAKRYSKTDRTGVNAVEHIVLRHLNWIFREQPIADMGIDAHIEQVLDDEPTGKLIGLQIKTGDSHFTHKHDHLIYYGNPVHAKYWLNHALPVIIIAHLPDTSKTYWQVVNSATVKYTKKGWKITIPFSNELSEKSEGKLASLLDERPEQAKLKKLFFDKELIEHILNGGQVNIYTEEWVHKSLGRGVFKVILIDNLGNEIVTRQWHSFYTTRLTTFIKSLFPWADIEVDESFYDLHFDEDSVYSMYSEAYVESNEIFPYKVIQDEVAAYRINLVVNQLGRSFIEVANFMEEE